MGDVADLGNDFEGFDDFGGKDGTVPPNPYDDDSWPNADSQFFGADLRWKTDNNEDVEVEGDEFILVGVWLVLWLFCWFGGWSLRRV